MEIEKIHGILLIQEGATIALGLRRVHSVQIATIKSSNIFKASTNGEIVEIYPIRQTRSERQAKEMPIITIKET